MGINAFIDLRPELLPDELPYSVELQVLARPLCSRFCAAAIRPTLCALGQFHTEASLSVKLNASHRLYEEFRSPALVPAQKLKAYQVRPPPPS